jgi:hypothetical protein
MSYELPKRRGFAFQKGLELSGIVLSAIAIVALGNSYPDTKWQETNFTFQNGFGFLPFQP